jgi:hypothetical protein
MAVRKTLSKTYDKRESLKEQDTKRDLDRIKKRCTIINKTKYFSIKVLFFQDQLTKIVKTLIRIAVENLLKKMHDKSNQNESSHNH